MQVNVFRLIKSSRDKSADNQLEIPRKLEVRGSKWPERHRRREADEVTDAGKEGGAVCGETLGSNRWREGDEERSPWRESVR